MSYIPPFIINKKILSLVASVSEKLGRISATYNENQSLLLRKVNRVIAPAREVQEASNALNVYEQLNNFQFSHEADLLLAHKNLMLGLIDSAGM